MLGYSRVSLAYWRRQRSARLGKGWISQLVGFVAMGSEVPRLGVVHRRGAYCSLDDAAGVVCVHGASWHRFTGYSTDGLRNGLAPAQRLGGVLDVRSEPGEGTKDHELRSLDPGSGWRRPS